MNYPIFNEAEAMQRIGDLALIKELLAEFAHMKELDWNSFEYNLAHNELHALDLASHSIKGVSGNLALTGIYLAATQLNDAIKNNQPDRFRELLDNLKSEVERFRSFLPEYLKKN